MAGASARMKRKSVPLRSRPTTPAVGHLDPDSARSTIQLPASMAVGARYRRVFLRFICSRLTRLASAFHVPYHTSPADKPIRASRQTDIGEGKKRDWNGTLKSCCAARLATAIATVIALRDTIHLILYECLMI